MLQQPSEININIRRNGASCNLITAPRIERRTEMSANEITIEYRLQTERRGDNNSLYT